MDVPRTPPTSTRALGSVKLTGTDKYRVRQGAGRILYSIRDDVATVTIIRVVTGRTPTV